MYTLWSTYVSINERVLESAVRGTLDLIVCMGVKLDIWVQVGQAGIMYFDDYYFLEFIGRLKRKDKVGTYLRTLGMQIYSPKKKRLLSRAGFAVFATMLFSQVS